MCGRIVVDSKQLESFLRTGGLGGAPHLLSHWFAGPNALPPSSWNIAPTQRLPVAFTDPATGDRRSTHAHWSLVPRNAPSLTLKYPTFNARSETAAEKPTFRRAVREGRCIIPVTGFYEWTGAARNRTPHAISGPAPMLALAGLVEWWSGPPGHAGTADTAGTAAVPAGAAAVPAPPLATVTVLTTASHGVMSELHDRMPIFVGDADIAPWLEPRTRGDAALLADYAQRAAGISEQLRTHPVAPLRGDGPHLLVPAHDAEDLGENNTPTLW